MARDLVLLSGTSMCRLPSPQDASQQDHNHQQQAVSVSAKGKEGTHQDTASRDAHGQQGNVARLGPQAQLAFLVEFLYTLQPITEAAHRSASRSSSLASGSPG